MTILLDNVSLSMDAKITTASSMLTSNITDPTFIFVMPHNNVTKLFQVNNTYDDNSYCEPLNSTPLIITAGLVGVLVVVCNFLVILAIAGGNANFYRPMYWLIIQLSISDCLVGIMLLWNYCLAAILDIHNTLTSLSILQGFWVTSASASVVGILLLAVDRYMQVVHKRMHKLYFNQFTVGIAMFLTWTIPLLCFLILPISLNWSCKENCSCIKGSYMKCLPVEVCSQIIPPFTKSYSLVVALFLYIIMPFPVLIYSLIYLKARKSTQQVRQKLRRRDIRLIQTLVVIMVAFIITLLPCGVVLIIDFLTKDYNTKLTDYALYVIMFASSNSLANPILYIWRIPAIRLSLQKRLKCCFKHNITSESRLSKFPHKLTLTHASNDIQEKHHMKFMLCGKTIYTSNLSEDSQHSTPMIQRTASSDKIFITKKGNSNKSLKMQRTSTSEYVICKRTPPPSPLCSNLTVQTNRKKQITRRVRELSGSVDGDETTEILFEYPNKSSTLTDNNTAQYLKPDVVKFNSKVYKTTTN